MSAETLVIFSQGLTAEEVEALPVRLNRDAALADALTALCAAHGPALRPGESARWQVDPWPLEHVPSVREVWARGESIYLWNPLGRRLRIGRHSGDWLAPKWRTMTDSHNVRRLVWPIVRRLAALFGSPRLIYVPNTGGKASGGASRAEIDAPLEAIERWLLVNAGPPSASFTAIAAAIAAGRRKNIDDGYLIDTLGG